MVLVQLYHSLIHPFLTFSLITWGTTYQMTLLPLITLQKRAVRIITFSEYNCHSSPLFRKLKILKVSDLLYLYLRNRKHIPCFYRVIQKYNTSGSLGEREMLWEHEPQASVFTVFLELSQTFTSVCMTR